jgi:hypothetical protein
MLRGACVLALSAFAFSVSYAFVEYYVIRDTTLGYSPVMFSLVYPYHFVMASVFVLAAYGLLRVHGNMKGPATCLIVIGALFSSMLALEDFTWFALRAVAPVQGDANAGRLIMAGEWTTQFMGSVDAHFTAIPNWYFLTVAFWVLAPAALRGKERPAAFATGYLLTT